MDKEELEKKLQELEVKYRRLSAKTSLLESNQKDLMEVCKNMLIYLEKFKHPISRIMVIISVCISTFINQAPYLLPIIFSFLQ